MTQLTSTVPAAIPGIAAPLRPALGLAQAVQHWAWHTPTMPACTYVDYGVVRDGVAETWSYAELDARARGVAAALTESTVAGDRIAVLLPQGLEYLAAFLGCLYAGRLAVPLYVPDLRRGNDRIISAVADSRPAGVIVLSTDFEQVRGIVPGGLVLCVDQIAPARAAVPPRPGPGGTGVAYLQYTSGSTRRPSGVLVTHDNLAAGAVQLRTSVRVGETGPTVSWLPFFHDMGLLFGIAAPLHAGGHAVYLSPFAFVQRPGRWLELISGYRAASTASPNFGLDLATRRVPVAVREQLDLSCLTVLANGAEPIRAQVLRDFTDLYRPHGFRPSAHRPGYGLAEATLMVTVSAARPEPMIRGFSRAGLAVGLARPVPEPDTDAVTLVSCGTAQQQRIRLVDPDTGTELAAGRVGEVWVHGPNVCAGYFDQPDLSTRTFAARPTDAGPAAALPGQPVAGRDTAVLAADGTPLPSSGWMRTGDLGFLADGELYLTSRLKDLVIINGRNHYPIDLEASAELALPAARPGHVVAFGVEVGGAEALVMVVEIEARRLAGFDPAAARTTLRGVLSHEHEVELRAVVFARPGAIPKTTSGKLQRHACRTRYLNGDLPTITGSSDGQP